MTHSGISPQADSETSLSHSKPVFESPHGGGCLSVSLPA